MGLSQPVFILLVGDNIIVVKVDGQLVGDVDELLVGKFLAFPHPRTQVVESLKGQTISGAELEGVTLAVTYEFELHL